MARLAAVLPGTQILPGIVLELAAPQSPVPRRLLNQQSYFAQLKRFTGTYLFVEFLNFIRTRLGIGGNKCMDKDIAIIKCSNFQRNDGGAAQVDGLRIF